MAAAVDTAVRGDAGLALAAGRIPDPPYPGIRPFEEDEWPIFFGRQAIIEELLERLSRRRFVAVVGASGGGKSSLIKAGLFATLRHKHKRLGVTWRTATMRPAGSPMWSLAEALYRTLERAPVAPDAVAPADAVEPYRAALARGPRAIAAILEEHGSPAQDNLLLLVDQFEELFRYDVLGGEAEISTFLDQLVDVIDQPPDGFYLALRFPRRLRPLPALRRRPQPGELPVAPDERSRDCGGDRPARRAPGRPYRTRPPRSPDPRRERRAGPLAAPPACADVALGARAQAARRRRRGRRQGGARSRRL
jgi:hypothetical protein